MKLKSKKFLIGFIYIFSSILFFFAGIIFHIKLTQYLDASISYSYQMKAWELIKNKRYLEALMDLSKAEVWSPEDANIYIMMGDIFYQMGEYALSLSSYKKSLKYLGQDCGYVKRYVEDKIRMIENIKNNRKR